MKVFSAIEKKDYTINKYNATAVLDWEFVSASQGIALTVPADFSGSTNIITINKARKESGSFDYDLVNVDTGYYHNSLHASLNHLFYSNNNFFFSGSTLITSSAAGLQDNVYVVSIPQNLYGDKVKPGSFELQIDSLPTKVFDDTYGNLYVSASSVGYYIGNIFYSKGIAVITEKTGSVIPTTTSSFGVTNSGASSYTFTGDATGTNPTFTLVRGRYYEFTVNAPGHPFWIQTTNPNPSGYDSGNVYNTGVTNNGTQSGTIKFLVPLSAPNTLYYVCQFHPGMRGTINVIDYVPGSEVSVDGIKIVSGSGITLSYDSSLELEQHQINIRIGPEEYNHSIFNPSTKRGLTATGSVTQSFIDAGIPTSSTNTWTIGKLMGTDLVKPYITTIGLYNDQYELLGVAKLSTPIQRSFDAEQIFIIRFDIDNTVV